MDTLPDGVVTFLFTDIEGSTRLAHRLDDRWPVLLEAHHGLLRSVFPAFGGVEVSTAGDSFFVAFGEAARAVEAAVAMQHALANHDWDSGPTIKVRMGVHTGPSTRHGDTYAGLAVHTASRVESAAAGGQILITEDTLHAAGPLPAGVGALDLGPCRLKDLPSEVRLYQIVGPGLARDFPPIRGVDAAKNNVPVPTSTFVGRTDALASLHDLLDRHRLITLVGPGGSGKTRLSLELASERLHRYPDGVWLVELDPAADDAGVARAFAQALGVREEPGQSLVDLVAALVRDRDVLLVVDNCEHVVDPAARVVDRLLRAGPRVRVLASTREPLAIDGERLWPVPPLTCDPDHPMASEAIALLTDRVRSVHPDFVLSDEDLPAAVTVVERLDGLPLAIELAAGSTALLSLAEIAEQLDDRFGLLTHGRRTALARQRTLWGAIDWSYDLLDDPARKLLREAAIFPGSFDLDAIAEVCTGDDPAGIHTLARKSLVAVLPGGRFRLLESIAAFARERLIEAGEEATLARRHAEWFTAGVLDGEGADLDLVYADVAAALRWNAAHRPEAADALLGPLHRYWIRSGRWSEGRALASEILRQTAPANTPARADALASAFQLATMAGDTAVARALLDEVYAARLAEGDEKAAMTLVDFANLAAREGDLATADELLTESLAAARRSGHGPSLAVVLTHMADVARQRGDLDAAWKWCNEAWDTAEAIGSTEIAATLVTMLGCIAHQRGDYAEAGSWYRNALESARLSDDLTQLPYLLYCLATLALDADEAGAAGGDGGRSAGAGAEAASFLAEAIALGRDLDARADLAESLEAAARLLAPDAPNEAAALLGAVDGLRDAAHFARPVAEAPAHERLESALRGALGDAAFDDAVSSGAGAHLDDVIAGVLDELALRHPRPPASPP